MTVRTSFGELEKEISQKRNDAPGEENPFASPYSSRYLKKYGIVDPSLSENAEMWHVQYSDNQVRESLTRALVGHEHHWRSIPRLAKEVGVSDGRILGMLKQLDGAVVWSARRSKGGHPIVADARRYGAEEPLWNRLLSWISGRIL